MHIGMIAMSGVRVCDPELLRLGLTLPGFVDRSRVIAALPSLGLLTLAGMTPPPHTVEYLEVPDVRVMSDLPARFDLVAISSYTAQIREAYELASRYRQAGVPVVIGGPHVTAVPEEAARFCDAVAIGEGESCWRDIVADAARGKLRPQYGSREGWFSLADAPMPAYDLLDPSKYNRITVQTCRGCPHACEFCASSVLLTRGYKQKPIGKVLREIDRIREIWPNPFLEFADDNTFVDRRYWKALLPALAGRGIRWFAETDIGVADDDRLLELMRESGCAQVLIGLESPVEAGLKGMEQRDEWKLRRFPRYRESIRRIQSHGISVNGCFVLGLDGHDTSVFDDVFDFVAETELYEVQITVMTAFPGTPLYTRLKKEGRVIDAASWEKCTLFDVNYRPSQMSPEELTQGFKELMGRLYNGELTTRRKRNFFRRYRAAAVTVAGGPGRESMVQASAAVAHAVAEAEIHWS